MSTEVPIAGDHTKVEKIEGPTLMTDKGFETPVSITVGEEEDIFASLRARGFSEEAIAAFKSGKIIKRNKLKLKDGREMILGEEWDGKQPDEGH